MMAKGAFRIYTDPQGVVPESLKLVTRRKKTQEIQGLAWLRSHKPLFVGPLKVFNCVKFQYACIIYSFSMYTENIQQQKYSPLLLPEVANY